MLQTASYSAFLHRKNLIGTRTAPRFDSYPDSDNDFDPDSDLLDYSNLTILATPQSRVVYSKDSESANAINNAWLVACLRDLPYQSGRPLSPVIGEEICDTALVDYNTSHSTPDRQVYVSLHGDDSILGSQVDRHANERLDHISDDELSVNAPQDESPQDKDNHRPRNHRRAARRRNTTTRAQQAPAQHGPRNLRRDFDEAADPAFCSPLINFAEAAILMQGLPDTPENCQIQHLTRDALHQIGRQHPAPSVSHNNQTPARQQDNLEADQDARPRGPHRPKYQDESHHAGPSRSHDRNRGNFNDARDIINARRHGHLTDETDWFPAFSQNINYAEYPTGFNPINMQNLKKYEGK